MASTIRNLAAGLVAAAASTFAAEAQAQTPVNNPNNLASVQAGAAAAVASSEAFTPFHNSGNANDGFYGNASAWVSGTLQNCWLKVDLGQVRTIAKLKGGRDREGSFGDRWWNDYQVWVATSENVYAPGDDSNDGAEYTLVASGFFGSHVPGASTEVNFAPVQARYVKLVILNSIPDDVVEPAVDEVEVEGAPETPFGGFTVNMLDVTFGATPGSDLAVVEGTFVLGGGNDGFDPLSEDVELVVGTHAAFLPAGSLVAGRRGAFNLAMPMSGLVTFSVNPTTGAFSGKLQNVNLDGTTPSSVAVELSLGNDRGATTRRVKGKLMLP